MGTNDPNGSIIRSTDNGTTWEKVTSPTENTFYAVTFGNDTFVAVGSTGLIVTSTDNGTTWDNATSGTIHAVRSISFGNNTFISGGGSGNIVTSLDNGTTWTTRDFGISSGQYLGISYKE